MDIDKREKRLGVFLAIIAVGIALMVYAWHIATWPIDDNSGTAKELICKIEPALTDFDSRNNNAANRAINGVIEEMDGYRKGIQPFVEDITGWGTRFGVIGRSSGDLWQKWWSKSENTNAVRHYISNKLEKHLFSDVGISNLVESAFKQFQDDLIASQNLLRADVETELEKMGLESIKVDVLGKIEQINKRSQETMIKRTVQSVGVGMTAEVGSAIVGWAAQVLATRVAAGIAASTATTAAASGGATATGTAVGGAGGSAAGPPGAIIGAAAGLVAGVVADLWMSREFKKKLTRECEGMITNAKNQIIGTDEDPGLGRAFKDAAHSMSDEGKTSVMNAIKEVVK